MPARHLPDRPFPPYTYVPGVAPHPLSDPTGHMYAEQSDESGVVTLYVNEWWRNEGYLWGIDLFNHGYYWEAHEAWEGLWHVAGRQGRIADFLKGLIKLAAAGVKVREGSRVGQQRHATRAARLFTIATDGNHTHCMGLSLEELSVVSLRCAEETLTWAADSAQAVRVFELILQPQR